MPTQHDMGPSSEIYRAILEYEIQPMKDVPNPHYNPNGGAYDRAKQPWRQFIKVPDGPPKTNERMIGPYQSITPIKAYVTRNRGGYNSTNLRIKRIERVSEWEEVEL